MYKLLLVLFLLKTSPGKPSAKGKTVVAPPRVEQILKTDSSKIAVRNFNAAAIKKYRSDAEFNYHVDTDKADSWWTRFWRWVWHVIEKLFGKKEGETKTITSASPLFQVVFYVLIIGLIAFLIVKAAGLTNIFGRKAQEIPLANSEWLEDINQITFDQEIEKAVAQRNYRLAVRLLYLRCLKQLNDARLIQWQIEKTNSAYLNELTGTEQKRSFGLLTRQFEYIWYGDFPVDSQSYQNISALFVDFKKTLP